MATKYLDSNGLLYFWGKIKSAFVSAVGYNSSTHQLTTTKNGTTSNVVAIPYKTSDLTNDSGFITSGDIPEGSAASTTTPLMDGTASVGTEMAFARGDHIHPSDTSRVPTTRTVNGHALSSNVTVTASDIGVESGAEVNILEGVQMNGTDLTITSKKVNVPLASASSNGVMSSTDYSKLASITMTNGKIDSSVLPSFVDDVIEAYARSNQTELGSAWLATGSATGTVITPETGKIYVLMNSSTNYDTNTQFRWGGSAYVKLNDGGVTAITNSEIDTIVAS